MSPKHKNHLTIQWMHVGSVFQPYLIAKEGCRPDLWKAAWMA